MSNNNIYIAIDTLGDKYTYTKEKDGFVAISRRYHQTILCMLLCLAGNPKWKCLQAEHGRNYQSDRCIHLTGGPTPENLKNNYRFRIYGRVQRKHLDSYCTV